MSVKKEVRSNFLEGVGLIVCDRLLSCIDNTCLESAVKLTEGNDCRGSAKAFDHTVHDRVIGNTDLEALEIFDAGNRVLEEEMTETFLAVEDTLNTESEIFRLFQEFSCKIALSKLPEVLSVLPCERDGKKSSFAAAVA
jgi:hypothetical protein